ncbi:MAG TPA: VanZ family protein [Thermoanaerobaculia bacterium]|jgi:VanZ family protein|nr:VanZ family protein [Thermoanaerobaculia bacterium]
MGRRQVHIIRVRASVTFALLALTTIAIASLIYFLSGKAYAAETHPIREILARLLGSGGGPVSRDALLAFLMPVLANVFLFVPWGFLAFLALDGRTRSRRAAYLWTIIGAVAFAAAMVLWQQTLPTRVTSLPDTFANGLGALAGAALGHARKSMRVQFDF